MDENLKKVPEIKGVIEKKFNVYFWQRYNDYKSPSFRIIYADAKKKMNITNQTFRNGLQYLANEGRIIYKYEARKRDTEITLTEKYIDELKIELGYQQLNPENLTELKSLSEDRDEKLISEYATEVPSNFSETDIDYITVIIERELDKRKGEENRKVIELQNEVERLVTKIDMLNSSLEELEIFKSSQDLLRERVRRLEKICFSKIQ